MIQLFLLLGFAKAFQWESVCEIEFNYQFECFHYNFNDICTPFDTSHCEVENVEYNAVFCPKYNCEVIKKHTQIV